MSRLTDLYNRFMYGTPERNLRILNSSGGEIPNNIMKEPTQGLFGTGGEKSGGLIDFNKMNNQQGGLLSNIPQTALLGSALFGQGLQGKDPFSALLPAVTQTAQLQKLMTPKLGALKQAYDPNKVNADGSKGGVIYADDKTIRAKGLTPALPTETISQTAGGGLTISKGYGDGGAKGSSKELERANDLKVTTFAMNNVADAMIQNLSTAKVGTVGGVISALDSVGSQLNQAAQSFGFAKNYKDTGSGVIDKYMTDNFNLSKEAVGYEKAKSQAINLAYLMANIDEKGGRFTDKDIAKKMEELGIGANPQKTIEVMKSAIGLRNDKAAYEYKLLTGLDLEISTSESAKKRKEEAARTDPMDLGL
mgnify:FL=1